MTVWYTAPTAIRMLMKAGADARARAHASRRCASSRASASRSTPRRSCWGEEAFGLPIHDNWWQTETGGIMIANYAAMDIRPGSMGQPLPGIEAAIVRAHDDGTRASRRRARRRGRARAQAGLAVDVPRLPRTSEERYRKCFAGGWYLTGDLARRDADGYFWFVGRADDVIKSSGHLIGPFEVESALMEHPAVAEAGVIGKPDPVAGEIVKAFVALKPGFAPSEDAAPRAARLTRASASAPRSRRRRSSSAERCRRRAAARSCGGC